MCPLERLPGPGTSESTWQRRPQWEPPGWGMQVKRAYRLLGSCKALEGSLGEFQHLHDLQGGRDPQFSQKQSTGGEWENKLT